MSDERAAAVYAGALCAAARDAGEIERVRTELVDFAEIFAVSPELRGALLDPQIDRATRRKVLAAVTEGGSTLLVNALQFLLDRGRMTIVGPMAEEFERLAERAADVVEVQVTSAVPLAVATESDLATRLETATGRHVRMVNCVDPAVIGGLSLRLGDDIVVDASVRTRIERLRERLTSASASTKGASQ